VVKTRPTTPRPNGVDLPSDSSTLYCRDFYHRQHDGSLRSANEIVPTLIHLLRPASVIDVGCGVGGWLSVFQQSGVTDVLGVDGEWVDPRDLLIPQDRFLAEDLRRGIHLQRRFDLALSLEVAEHLPMDCAKTFVDSLVALSPVVVFSAAVPRQGGTGHINEQWPDYWAALFERSGYQVLDVLRTRFWQNAAVEWWYAQNILLFALPTALEVPALRAAAGWTNRECLSVVHPRMETRLWTLTELDRRIGFAPNGPREQFRDNLRFTIRELSRHAYYRGQRGARAWAIRYLIRLMLRSKCARITLPYLIALLAPPGLYQTLRTTPRRPGVE
jgi:SAM-dependent methyltransferase